MGAIHFSLDLNLVQALKKTLPLDVFIETGTFHGDTLITMAPLFNELHSVELSKELWQESAERLKSHTNVKIEQGNSPHWISKLMPSIKEASALFWLDAHWCVSEKTAGENSQCPLIQEIVSIGHLNTNSAIIIDDARLFTAPPPEPHEISDWPIYEDVNSALRGLSSQHEIMIINDTIVFYPKQCRQPMIEYAAQHGTDWLKLKWAMEFAEGDNIELHKCQIRDDLILKNTTDVAKAIDVEIINSHCALLGLIANYELMDARLKLIQNKGLRSLLPPTLCKQVEGLIDAYYDTKAIWHRFKNKLLEYKRKLKIENLTIKFCEIGRLKHHNPKQFKIPNNFVRLKKSDIPPKISIVTPSFNQCQFIEMTIQSILNQNYPNLEYIIQDGGSNDGSDTVISKYESELAYWETKPDKGQSDAINLGFSRTSGDIMAWINSDDILFPGTLTYVAKYFMRHPNVDVIYSNRLLIDEDGMLIGKWVLPPHRNEVLKWADYIPQETMFWRRSIWDRVGGIDDTFKFAMDWDFICRMIDVNAKIVHIPKFFGGFRVHSLQKTSALVNTTGIAEMEIIRSRYHQKKITGIEIEEALLSYFRAHIFESRIKQKLRFTSL